MALGSDRFKEEIEATLQRAVRPPRRGRPSHQPQPSGD